MTNESLLDVVVVGGGPAGLAAALWLGRARRSVLVVDSGEPRNGPAAHSHGYLTRDGASPYELLKLGRQEVSGYGGEIIDGTVESIKRLPSGVFRVTLADGTERDARRILITTGLVDELPDVPGVRELWGRDVVHCPYCFGWDIRDTPIGILGTGPHAVMQAQMWRQWTADLTLFLHTAPTPTDGELEELAARGVTVVEGEVASLQLTDGRLTGVRMRSGELIERNTLVVAPRFEARHSLLDDLGVTTTELPMGVGRQVETDPTGRTTAPGIWAAGNTANLKAGVLQSAASGADAAVALNADLTTEDTTQAVAAHHS